VEAEEQEILDITYGLKSAINEIALDTLKTGKNKFAAQFTQSQ
jgi:hypothetical protein